MHVCIFYVNVYIYQYVDVYLCGSLYVFCMLLCVSICYVYIYVTSVYYVDCLFRWFLFVYVFCVLSIGISIFLIVYIINLYHIYYLYFEYYVYVVMYMCIFFYVYFMCSISFVCPSIMYKSIPLFFVYIFCVYL